MVSRDNGRWSAIDPDSDPFSDDEDSSAWVPIAKQNEVEEAPGAPVGVAVVSPSPSRGSLSAPLGPTSWTHGDGRDGGDSEKDDPASPRDLYLVGNAQNDVSAPDASLSACLMWTPASLVEKEEGAVAVPSIVRVVSPTPSCDSRLASPSTNTTLGTSLSESGGGGNDYYEGDYGDDRVYGCRSSSSRRHHVRGEEEREENVDLETPRELFAAAVAASTVAFVTGGDREVYSEAFRYPSSLHRPQSMATPSAIGSSSFDGNKREEDKAEVKDESFWKEAIASEKVFSYSTDAASRNSPSEGGGRPGREMALIGATSDEYDTPLPSPNPSPRLKPRFGSKEQESVDALNVSGACRSASTLNSDVEPSEWTSAKRALSLKLRGELSDAGNGPSGEEDDWPSLLWRCLVALGINGDALGVIVGGNEGSSVSSVSNVCKRAMSGNGVFGSWADEPTFSTWLLGCVAIPALCADGTTIIVLPNDRNQAIIDFVRDSNKQTFRNKMGVVFEPLINAMQGDDDNLESGKGILQGSKVLCKHVFELREGRGRNQSQDRMPRIFVTNGKNLLCRAIRVQLQRLIELPDGIARFVAVQDSGPIGNKLVQHVTYFIEQFSVFKSIPWSLLMGGNHRDFVALAKKLNLALCVSEPHLTFGLSMPKDLVHKISRLPFIIQFELSRFHKSRKGDFHLKEEQLRKILSDEFIDDSAKRSNIYELLSRVHKEANSVMTYGSCLPRNSEKKSADEGTVSLLKFSAELEGKGQMRLCPPEVIRFDDKRVYRKFGSHRFLEVAALRGVSKNLLRKLCGQNEGRKFRLAGREYGLLYCKATESSQVYVLFAEKGMGISADEEITAEQVEDWAIPARYNPDLTIDKKMKRLKLSFSNTIQAGQIPDKSLEIEQDVVSPEQNLMTDGCGLLSRGALDFIWRNYQTNRKARQELFLARQDFVSIDDASQTRSLQEEVKSASEIQAENNDEDCPYTSFSGRIGPFKGLWVLDTSIGDGIKVICRPSQKKYELPMRSLVEAKEDEEYVPVYDPVYDTVDVCGWDSNPPHARLNRRAVQILSSRGVPDQFFLEKAEEAIKDLRSAHESHREILMHHAYLEGSGLPDESLILRMALAEVPLDEPTFWTEIKSYIHSKVKSMKEKANYPLRNSAYLRMIPDHYKILAPNEAFVVLRGEPVVRKVVAMRSPSYFADDLITLKAVSLDTLLERSGFYNEKLFCFYKKLRNGIVLSTQGNKSPADMMSGGDFDGDTALVIFEPKIVEHIGSSESRSRNTLIEKTPEESVLAARNDPVRTNQTLEYCFNFKNHGGCLGQLSNALDVAIDKYGFGDKKVEELGIKNFLQVDHPYKMQCLSQQEESEFNSGSRPHWFSGSCSQQKEYTSETILGKLFDRMDLCVSPNYRECPREGCCYIEEVVRLGRKRSEDDDVFKEKFREMERNMERAVPEYNRRLREILFGGDASVKMKQHSKSIASLGAEFRTRLIESFVSLDDRHLAASLLYQKALACWIKNLEWEPDKKPYQIAWKICVDYLTRIVADARDKNNGSTKLSVTLTRENYSWLSRGCRKGGRKSPANLHG